MDENVQRLRVGIYTVIVILILGILIFLNSEGWNSTYTVILKPHPRPGFWSVLLSGKMEF